MVKKAVNFFISKSKRERIMLLCVIATAAIVWLSALVGSYNEINEEIATQQKRIDIANTVIAQEVAIQNRLEEIKKVFDPNKTVSPVDLQIAIEDCAKAAELTYSLSQSATKEVGKFKIHTINLSAQRANLKNFAIFESKIAEKEPYITLSRSTFDGESGAVSVRYTIAAFELLETSKN